MLATQLCVNYATSHAVYNCMVKYSQALQHEREVMMQWQNSYMDPNVQLASPMQLATRKLGMHSKLQGNVVHHGVELLLLVLMIFLLAIPKSLLRNSKGIFIHLQMIYRCLHQEIKNHGGYYCSCVCTYREDSCCQFPCKLHHGGRICDGGSTIHCDPVYGLTAGIQHCSCSCKQVGQQKGQLQQEHQSRNNKEYVQADMP